MFCSNCGFQLIDGDIFCGSCGAAVNSASATATTDYGKSDLAKKDYDYITRIKPFLITAFILLITNPLFSALNLFNAYNPFTQEKETYEYFSLMTLVFEIGVEVPFIFVIAVLGIILLIVSAIIMIIPLIKKSKPMPKYFILAKIISIIALLANSGVITIVFFEINDRQYSDIIKLSVGGIITIIACILLVAAVFVTASKVKKENRSFEKNEIYFKK